MTSEDERLNDVNRRSIRILAGSTKAGGPANARVAERLERAAGTGDPVDFRRAEASFDALPADERRRIGTHAENQAKTERRLVKVRKRKLAARTNSVPERPVIVDDTLDWKPLVLDHTPAIDSPALKPQTGPRPTAAKQAAAPASRPRKPTFLLEPEPAPKRDDPDKGWDWQRIPEDPALKSARKKQPATDPIEELRRQILGDDTKRR